MIRDFYNLTPAVNETGLAPDVMADSALQSAIVASPPACTGTVQTASVASPPAPIIFAAGRNDFFGHFFLKQYKIQLEIV